MSSCVLIEAVEVEGFGGGGVVAAACGDVQVAGVLECSGDDGVDGGQIDGAVAGAAGGGVLAEGDVADVVVGLDASVLADEPGQAGCGGAGADQGGDGVDRLA